MHKFFTEHIDEKEAIILGEDVKHAWKVLRLKENDYVEINDLNENEYLGVIKEINKEKVRVSIIKKLDYNNESPLNIILYQGIPKGQKMELICQKVNELGCNRVVPLITERIVPNAQNEYKKLDRLKRIIFESSKQAKRSKIMDISNPIDIATLKDEISELDILIVPYESEFLGEKRGIKEIEDIIKMSNNIGVVVGPEGGFSLDEIKFLENIGSKIVTLGPRILRTETAGMAVVSILQYNKGDLGGKIKSSN